MFSTHFYLVLMIFACYTRGCFNFKKELKPKKSDKTSIGYRVIILVIYGIPHFNMSKTAYFA